MRRKMFVEFNEGRVANLFRMHASGTLLGKAVPPCCTVMSATTSTKNSRSVDLEIETDAAENEISQLPGKIADHLRLLDIFKSHVSDAGFIQEAA